MSSGGQPFLSFRDVHKSFGAKRVLRGVSLDVGAGETVVVLGGSGSGKSVLLRHAIGLMRPDSGQVVVDGVDLTGLGERELAETRKKVGMLFQSGALFDSLDVCENVAFALREHTDMDDRAIAERVAEILGRVDLAGTEELMPSDLSGGMRKRVALARAIALAPRAILYDEPTTGLDPVTARTIDELIRSLQVGLGVTGVVVTHDIESAFRLADRIAFLHEGRIEFLGRPEEARTSGPPLLRRFLGEEGGRVS